jgi:predicted branched-subunit amino acid permease
MHEDVHAGVRAALPFQIGIVPFGLVTGIAAVEVGLSPWQALGTSMVVYAGASQLAAYELLDSATPLVVVVGTALAVNLRMMMYSASIAPHFAEYGQRIRAVVAYLLVDPLYAMSVTEFERNESRDRFRYYMGLGCTIWLGWNLGTAAGIVFGTRLPSGLELSFAIPLIFLALLAPRMTGWPSVAAGGVAGATALFAGRLPFDLGLVVGGVVGVAAGLLAERWEDS